MKRLIAKINHLGLDGLEDPLHYRRVLFINSLSLVTIFVTYGVTVLIGIENLFPQFYVTMVGGSLFALVLYLNYKRKYRAARAYFLLLSVSTLILASFVAFEQGRFNETENILIGFMAVNYLLYDSKLRYIGFLIIYAVLMWLKFVKQGYMGNPYDFNFFINLQNTSILCLLIFLFAEAFRQSLLKAFMRLKDKDELLYSMIDSVPLFIGLVGKDLKYRMVNLSYERAFGMKRDKIIGSRLDEVLPPNILEKHQPLVEAALRGESPEFLELTELPDGTTFYAGGKYTPIKNDNEVVGVAVFVNDVTKLESARNKLDDANQSKDKLFSIIAHDLKSPLDLFEGLLAVSSDGALSQEDFFKYQKDVKEKVGALQDTMNTLLEWARTQLDGINVKLTDVDIREVVESNIDLYAELIRKKGILMEVDIPEGLKVWADKNHLKVSFRNLIHNALKFTPPKGTVAISAVGNGSYIKLAIQDSGIGMDKEKIASILKREFQSSSAGTEGERGTGLGLGLSLELLEKNNCKVSMSSQSGQGTRVEIEIPKSER
ncbi:MAG: PAS domain-containing sensor histidine kinase [Ekhidna sp.]|uniref:sensor histidine kinase n=1 Tax=Ekhidna sp. TaxID=2608089 RepID=UPI0032EC3154